jgi:membrane protein DedA with SNARE-associated domain
VRERQQADRERKIVDHFEAVALTRVLSPAGWLLLGMALESAWDQHDTVRFSVILGGTLLLLLLGYWLLWREFRRA